MDVETPNHLFRYQNVNQSEIRPVARLHTALLYSLYKLSLELGFHTKHENISLTLHLHLKIPYP
jgi:hypothetical protein